MQGNSYRLLDRNEAAEYLGISATVLGRLTRKGYIAYIDAPSSGKAGRPTRKWTIRDLNDFIDSRRRRAGTPTISVEAKPRRRRGRASLKLQYATAAEVLNMDDSTQGGAQ